MSLHMRRLPLFTLLVVVGAVGSKTKTAVFGAVVSYVPLFCDGCFKLEIDARRDTRLNSKTLLGVPSYRKWWHYPYIADLARDLKYPLLASTPSWATQNVGSLFSRCKLESV